MKDIFKNAKSKIISRIFEIGVSVKAVFGFFELLGGVLLVFSKERIIDNFILDMARQEIAEDANDIVANFLVNFANSLYFDTRIFAVAYLLFHGVVNLYIAMALIKGRSKVYIEAIMLLGIFLIFQIYKFLHNLSWGLAVLIVFDIAFIYVIWLEGNKKKRHKMSASY